jgi:futalosine hydrolase
LLIVTAVEAERAAVLRGLGRRASAVVQAVGVGAAAAAAATARTLATAEGAGQPFKMVTCTGIAGGFADRTARGGAVIGTRSVAADLGAASAEGFIPLADLGLGSSVLDSDTGLVAVLRQALPDAVTGEVLTVSTVTGSAERAAELLRLRPNAVAEAMEGFGAATAARQAGTAFAELRTISNPVGPRDRAAWRIREALAALESAWRVLAIAGFAGRQDPDDHDVAAAAGGAGGAGRQEQQASLES